eukprot:403376507
MNFQEFLPELTTCGQFKHQKEQVRIKGDLQVTRFFQLEDDNTLSIKRGCPSFTTPMSIQFDKVFESREVNSTPISYFEVTLQEVAKKSKSFYIGLATNDLHFQKYCGETAESISIRGDRHIIYQGREEKTNLPRPSTSTQIYTQAETIGIGLIHKTQEIFFTFRQQELYQMKLPASMINKKLYPTVSMTSKDETLKLSFGQQSFNFDLDKKLSDYYQQIYKSITQNPKLSSDDIGILVRDYLVKEGHFSVLKALDEQDQKRVEVQSDEVLDPENHSQNNVKLKFSNNPRSMRLNSMQESQFFLSNKNNLLKQESEVQSQVFDQNLSINQQRNERIDSFISGFEDDNISQQTGLGGGLGELKSEQGLQKFINQRPRFESMADIPSQKKNSNTKQKSQEPKISSYKYDLPIRNRIKKFIMKSKIPEAIQALEEYFPEVINNNQDNKIKCSLHSIQMISYLKEQRIEQSLKYLSKYLTPHQNEKAIITQTLQQKQIIIYVKELCNFYMYTDLSKCDYRPYMLTINHNKAVADFVNQQIVQYLKLKLDQQSLHYNIDPLEGDSKKRNLKSLSKLEKFMTHTALTINALSDPQLSSEKQRCINLARSKNVERHIGVKMTHNKMVDEREQ